MDREITQGAAADDGPGGPAAQGTAAPEADASLDAIGEGCATLTPLIRARVRVLESGQVLEVVCDDPAAREGVAAWSRLTGHELLNVVDDGGNRARFYIRRK